MTPTDPSPLEAPEPADSGRNDSPGQPMQPRRRGRAARKRPTPAERPERKSGLLAFAFSEYERLRQQGETPDISRFCQCFPECGNTLRLMLELESAAVKHIPDERRLPDSNDESINWPREGEQRGDFTILRELDRGALARVYLAAEASTGGRLVALKCSLHGDAEARTLGRLSHPHIVPILSARLDEQSGLTMVVMPYLGSTTLEDVLDCSLVVEPAPSQASFFLDVLHRRVQPDDPSPVSVDPCLLHGSYAEGVIHLAVQLAETLAFLHQHGVSHRDLKPSNVLLDPSGKPLLLDFNLSGSDREKAALVGGTLRYMPPEQIRAYLEKRKDGMDERVDLFSLGVMVYELLGGTHPCESLLAQPVHTAQAEAMLIELKAGFRPFREICPELGRPVAAILDRCVALAPSVRPGSALELAATLKRQFAPARQLRRWLALHRRWLAATLAFLLVVLAVLGFVWAITPPYSEREYDRGRIAYRASDFGAAEMHFDHACRAAPNNARFRYARGCARLQQSKYLPKDAVNFDEIRDDLTSNEQGTADPKSLAVSAYFRVRNQNYQEAIKIYDQLQAAGYRPVMVLNNRAYCYVSTGQFPKARSDLDRAVQLNPRCQAVRYNRATVAMRSRKQSEAISPQALEDIEQALRLGPTAPALYRDAAILYALADEDDLRHAYFDRALSCLHQAIAGGEAPVMFRSVPSLRNALKRPEFAALLRPDSPKSFLQEDLRLIDPVDLPD